MSALFGRLRALGRQPSPARVRGALREAYLTAFALLALPGVLLGLAFGRGLRVEGEVVLILALVGLSLALLVVWLSLRARTREDTRLAGALRASVQLASAPAVPFLIGCAFLGQLPALAVLWGLALLVGLVGWLLVRP